MNSLKNIRLLNGTISYLIDQKAITKLILLMFIMFITFIISAGLGDLKIDPLTVISVLFGGGERLERLVVLDFRLPRIIIALLVGIGLAVAGSILQGLVRNPLASPDIIGITGGASVFVVSFLAFFSDTNGSLTVSINWLPVAAFLGASVIAIVVYTLSWKNGISPLRLILIGIGISALTQSLTTLFMILGPIYRAGDANIWITGTVHGSNWSNVFILTPWILILLFITWGLSRQLNVQELGKEIATGVGGNVQKQRFILLLLSTGLIGGSVAFAGGIGFVGLMAPHIARRIVGSSYEVLLPVAAIIGAILVMISDLIGRIAFSPLEIPAGVFTAAIGAPYFIYLLLKAR
ncbi:iron ABC transporter permease [Lottiidibacillus patelloidae]|uniref:Iron ABC transporter permease n=1 Tax=Lottiidibacillus patelloidae TaxID=2670334 RepID=A0A263BSD6_9BACI|nr:iron ABC transporter permease [Lottiidibacillus patelloidae]OZM56630.1 iron ABC transporter permease [Lottiidibacillus patelloidae]